MILIATNLLARGFDNRNIYFTINYDCPTKKLNKIKEIADHDHYLHRIGRSGRFGDKGIGLTFITHN